MKLLGRILAIIIAGIISVIAVQRVIRRMYDGFAGKYVDLPTDDKPGDGQ